MFKKSYFCLLGASVEVDKTTDKKTVAVRDSNVPKTIITCSHDEWKEFI